MGDCRSRDLRQTNVGSSAASHGSPTKVDWMLNAMTTHAPSNLESKSLFEMIGAIAEPKRSALSLRFSHSPEHGVMLLVSRFETTDRRNCCQIREMGSVEPMAL